MGRNSEFHNVIIKYFCQQNGVRIDSAGTRVLTQNISSCLCRIIYVHLHSLFDDIGSFSNSKEKSKENAYYK